MSSTDAMEQGPTSQPGPDKHFHVVEVDGRHEVLLSYRSSEGTVVGTTWRLVLDNNQAFMIVPTQLPTKPAKRLHAAPTEIRSIYGDALWLISWVGLRTTALEGYRDASGKRVDWHQVEEARARKEVEQENARFNRLRSVQDFNKRRSYYHELTRKLPQDGPASEPLWEEAKEKAGVVEGTPFMVKFRKLAYQHNQRIQRIKERHRAHVREVMMKEQERKDALAKQQEIRRFLVRHGVERPSKAVLVSLLDFIGSPTKTARRAKMDKSTVEQLADYFTEVESDLGLTGIYHHPRHDHAVRFLKRVQELTGTDIRFSVMQANGEAVRAHLQQRCKEVEQEMGMPPDQARAWMVAHAGYLAEFGAGILELVDRFHVDMHSPEDRGDFVQVRQQLGPEFDALMKEFRVAVAAMRETKNREPIPNPPAVIAGEEAVYANLSTGARRPEATYMLTRKQLKSDLPKYGVTLPDQIQFDSWLRNMPERQFKAIHRGEKANIKYDVRLFLPKTKSLEIFGSYPGVEEEKVVKKA